MRPLTVLVAMLSETGHYTGTFRLASLLRARGHRVVYLGIADFEDVVTARGFDFVALAPDLLPKGYAAEFAASLAPEAEGKTARRPRRRENEALFAAWLARIEDGSLDDAISAQRPDIVLCDPFVWYVALRALKLGIPTLNLRIVLHHHSNASIPPVSTSLPPARSPLEALRVRSAWYRMHIGFVASRRLASRVRGDFRLPTRMHHLEDVFLRVARGAGFDARAGRTYWRGEMGPWLELPSVVLVPRAFQFRQAVDGDRICYAGDVVDLDRPEEPLPFEPRASDRTADPPLVYASLGTSAHFYRHATRFFRAVSGLAARRPDWHVVLHAGDLVEDAMAAPPLPNLIVRRRVPQIALLRRAAVMITHGGINSILECIRFEVPMVIVPAKRDQPGNAARSVHHGIALTAEMARVSAEELEALVERARTDASMRRALSEMKRRIEAEPGLAGAVDFIERHAARA